MTKLSEVARGHRAYERRVEIRFPADLHDQVISRAKASGVGVSGLIRYAIMRYLFPRRRIFRHNRRK